MKSAKIMLTAIAVLGVAGGALAVKTSSILTVWCKADPPNALCTVTTIIGLTTTVGPFGFFAQVTRPNPDGNCPNITCLARVTNFAGN